MINYLYFAIGAFLLALPLTYVAKQYALTKQLVDVPDERRNHRQITPRGGGIGFVVGFIIILIALYSTGMVEQRVFLPMLLGAIIVSILGYLDDHRDIPSLLRLVMQIITALIVLWLLPLPDSFHVINNFHVTGMALQLGIFISIIWLINVYNFMDGVDALAAVEVISVSLIMLGLLYGQGSLNNQAALLSVLVASTLGFLIFNWPPATIFMGDVGSYFLGFMMGMMALILWSIDDNSMWAWVILQGIFVIDTVVTLLRRVARRTSVFEAHSQHAYQQAYRKQGSVIKLLAASVLIKLVWLAPCAWLVMNALLTPLFAICIAFIPLVIIAYCYNAGVACDDTQHK